MYFTNGPEKDQDDWAEGSTEEEEGDRKETAQQEQNKRADHPTPCKKRQRTNPSPPKPSDDSNMDIDDEEIISAGMHVPVRVEERQYGVPFLILKVESASGVSVTGWYYSLSKRGDSNVANKWTPDFEEVEGTPGLVPLQRTLERKNLIPVRISWKTLVPSGHKEGGYLARATLVRIQEFLNKRVDSTGLVHHVSVGEDACLRQSKLR
jgi:hypothetical protein